MSVPKIAPRRPRIRYCDYCGERIEKKLRRDAIYCAAACRQAAYEDRKKQRAPSTA